MNKKFMIGGCAVATVAGNMFAVDEGTWFAPYASLRAGCAFLGKRDDIKYKCGFAGAVELGMSYDAWRFGIELGFKSNKIKDFKLPGGEQGTHFILNGGYDAAAGAITDRDATTAGNVAHASMVAIGEKSVFNMNAHNAAHTAFFGMDVSGNGFQTLGLKNVTEVKFEKMSAMTGMINVFYDYAMTEAWSLYAGVGLGAARVNLTVSTRNSGVTTGAKKIGAEKAHNAVPYTEAEAKAAVLAALPKFFEGNNDAKWSKTEHSKTVFAWQLMAGVGYEFDENWKLTLGYKLFNTAKLKFGDAKIKTPFNHTAELGLTYTF